MCTHHKGQRVSKQHGGFETEDEQYIQGGGQTGLHNSLRYHHYFSPSLVNLLSEVVGVCL